MRTILLDNEAVHALAPGHAKHGVIMSHLAGTAARRRRGASVRAVVPTAVRVEAGWDRSGAGAAAINRFRIDDVALDGPAANLAAGIVVRTGVSVADGHVGAVVATLHAAAEVVVLTSDPEDMVLVSAPRAITTVRI